MICYAFSGKTTISRTMIDVNGQPIDVVFLLKSLSVGERLFSDGVYNMVGAVEFEMDKNADGWFASDMWFKLKGVFFHSETGPAVWGTSLKYDDGTIIDSAFMLRGEEYPVKEWLDQVNLSKKDQALLLLQHS